MTTITPDAEAAADWFDELLDTTWTRSEHAVNFGREVWFDHGNPRNPETRIVVHLDDERIQIHEFDQYGCLAATTSFSGDMTRQAPRVMRMLDIEI